MGFTQVKTFSFRNLQDQVVDLEGLNIFLTGQNGQGKSNFLESIYILCFGSSFRTRSESLLVKHGHAETTLFGTYNREGEYSNTISFNYKGSKKKILLNGKAVKDRKNLINNIPSIVFTHDDLSFINGTPDRKRWFFNQIMSIYDLVFIDLLRNYGKILKIRNAELKNDGSKLMDVINYQLAEAGLAIQKKRESAVKEFNTVFTPIFSSISQLEKEVFIKYEPSWKDCETAADINVKLEKSWKNDLFTGSTTTGVHRDRFEYYMDNRNFSKIASTGQLRLISLVMRITQSIFYLKKTARKPILLLDDVLLELDSERRNRFFNYLPEYEQAFFTFLPGEHVYDRIQENVKMYDVAEGVLTAK